MKYEKTETLLALYRVGRRVKFAAKAGSTDSMLTAAILLGLEGDPVTLSELGEHLAMKPAAMSEQIAKLEEEKLVGKKTGKDKRAKILSLTANGKKAASQLREALEEHGAGIFSRMAAPEISLLHKLLQRLAV